MSVGGFGRTWRHCARSKTLMIPLHFALLVFRGRSTLHGYGALMLLIVLLFTTQGCKGKQKANAAERRANPNEVTITPALEKNLRFGTPEMAEVDGTLQVAAHV